MRAEDIPADLGGSASPELSSQDWTQALSQWAWCQFEAGGANVLLDIALPKFETALIKAALKRAKGRKQDAARLLGWGRNTLSRKMKELNID